MNGNDKKLTNKAILNGNDKKLTNESILNENKNMLAKKIQEYDQLSIKYHKISSQIDELKKENVKTTQIVNKQSEQLRETSKTLADREQKLVNAQTILSKTAVQFDKLKIENVKTTQIVNKQSAQLRETAKTLADSEQKLVNAQAILSKTAVQSQILEKKLKKEKTNLQKRLLEIEEKSHLMSIAEKKISDLNNNNKLLLNRIQDTEEKLAQSAKFLELKNQQLARKNEMTTQLENRLSINLTKSQLLNELLLRLKNEGISLSSQHKQCQNSLTATEEKLDHAKVDIETTQKQLAKIRLQSTATKLNSDQLDQALKLCKSLNDDANREIEKLKTQIEAQKNELQQSKLNADAIVEKNIKIEQKFQEQINDYEHKLVTLQQAFDLSKQNEIKLLSVQKKQFAEKLQRTEVLLKTHIQTISELNKQQEIMETEYVIALQDCTQEHVNLEVRHGEPSEKLELLKSTE